MLAIQLSMLLKSSRIGAYSQLILTFDTKFDITTPNSAFSSKLNKIKVLYFNLKQV